jgi:ABC-2 type transport system permease protein
VSVVGRTRSEFRAALRAFLRRRTAVFFTFLFPAILIVIFGALVETGAGSTGLFTEPPAYYVPGYLALVVVFTPLSRVSSTVARHREGNRFEKLATTPLRRWEWLVAHAAVNVAVVLAAALLVVGLVVGLTGADLVVGVAALPAVVAGTVLFCGGGALLGAYTGSRDGAVAASNALGFPIIFLSETFVTPATLPEWFGPLTALSPLTYFSRAVRRSLTPGATADPVAPLAVLVVLAAVVFALGAVSVPRTE